MEMSMEINDLFQKADWRKEKHVPVIECPSTIKKEELCDVKVSIGKEIAHPNTTEHHIAWISVFFKPTDDKFPYQIGQFLFLSKDRIQARSTHITRLPSRLRHQNQGHSLPSAIVTSMAYGNRLKRST